MVRLGIGVYGVSNDPAEQKYLENGNSEISDFQIRIITAGESVGYGRKFMAEKPLIATIPIGYADGISRGWGMGLDLSP
jgi:alanine racemase